MSTQRQEQHSGCYRDVPMVPVEVLGSIGSWVVREYGDRYAVGYVGTLPAVSAEIDYVFQVRATDGSRFLVATTRWGIPYRLLGSEALAFARRHQVEAYV